MQKPLLSWIYLIVLALIWGSSFMLMKFGMVAFTAMEVGALRIVFASVFLLPFLIRHYRVDLKKYWLPLLGMGLFGNLIPAFLFTTAETEISSSLAGMLNALTPVFTILVSIVAMRQNSKAHQVAGISIGFVGAVLLTVFARNEKHGSGNYLYALLVVAATFCYALSVNIIKKYLSNLNSVTASVWSFTFIGPMALTYLVCSGFFTHWQQINIQVPFYGSAHVYLFEARYACLLPIAILGIVGSAISVILFSTLIKNAGTVFASSVTYLIPVVALFWGLAIGEDISMGQVFGMLLVLGSILLINRAKN